MRDSFPRFVAIIVGVASIALAADPGSSPSPARGHGAEGKDMELVGHDDLQGRPAYQPTIHQQRGRFIAYVGHHSGKTRNPLTATDEDNGTSIVDVRDPYAPSEAGYYIPATTERTAGRGGTDGARSCKVAI
jgi:hypothetical protein